MKAFIALTAKWKADAKKLRDFADSHEGNPHLLHQAWMLEECIRELNSAIRKARKP